MPGQDDKNQPLGRRLQAIGISAPYASQLASGKRTPSLALAVKIERELGIPATSWLTGRGKKP